MKNNLKKNKANLPQNSKSKKSLLHYNFCIGSAKQALDHDIIMQFIINCMKKPTHVGMTLLRLFELQPCLILVNRNHS